MKQDAFARALSATIRNRLKCSCSDAVPLSAKLTVESRYPVSVLKLVATGFDVLSSYASRLDGRRVAAMTGLRCFGRGVRLIPPGTGVRPA
jgi:hypothetical protein